MTTSWLARCSRSRVWQTAPTTGACSAGPGATPPSLNGWSADDRGDPSSVILVRLVALLMVTSAPLFDDRERDDPAYIRPDESTYAFLDRVSGPEMAAPRDILNDWLGRWPLAD